MTISSCGRPPPQLSKVQASCFLPYKKRRRRKKKKDRKSNRRRPHSSVSALAKMDPRFIFNHAGPGPICLVYSAEERTGLGGDHYLDTQLTNEAGAAPPPLLPRLEAGLDSLSLSPISATQRQHPLTATLRSVLATVTNTHTTFLPPL